MFANHIRDSTVLANLDQRQYDRRGTRIMHSNMPDTGLTQRPSPPAFPSTLPWLNAIGGLVLYLLLFTRHRPFPASYVAVLGAAFLALTAIAGLTIRRRGRRWPGAGQRRVQTRKNVATRTFLAAAPWLALLIALVVRPLPWVQRPWQLRLFACYVLVNWTVICLTWSTNAPRAGGVARRVAVMAAAGLIAAGIEGLAWGRSDFGAILSALLVVAAVGGVAIARFESSLAQARWLTLVVATVLALVAFEGMVRAAHIGDNVAAQSNADYARRFFDITMPRAAFVSQPKLLDEFPPVLIETNSIGIRGPEIPTRPVDILAIGDSFVEARQVAWERSVGPQLQQALRARAVNATVASFGMRGWSTLLEWNWFLKVGRRLHPKNVLLFYFWNDLWPVGDEVSTFHAVLTPEGRPDHFEIDVEPGWLWYRPFRVLRLAGEVYTRLGWSNVKRAFASQWSSLHGRTSGALDEAAARVVAKQLVREPVLSPNEIERLLTRDPATLGADLRAISGEAFWPSLRPLAIWTPEQRRAADKAETELERFAEDVKVAGGHLTILYVPNPYQVGTKECTIGRYFDRLDADVLFAPTSGIQEWLRGVSERRHIELLDPTDNMRAQSLGSSEQAARLYLRSDCHWTEEGHRFIAGFLAEWYLAGVAGGGGQQPSAETAR